VLAYRLARDVLPDSSGKFGRRDSTLPQLFSCLVVKEQLGRSYRGAEALLRDCRHWRRRPADVGDVGDVAPVGRKKSGRSAGRGGVCEIG